VEALALPWRGAYGWPPDDGATDGLAAGLVAGPALPALSALIAVVAAWARRRSGSTAAPGVPASAGVAVVPRELGNQLPIGRVTAERAPAAGEKAVAEPTIRRRGARTPAADACAANCAGGVARAVAVARRSDPDRAPPSPASARAPGIPPAPSGLADIDDSGELCIAAPVTWSCGEPLSADRNTTAFRAEVKRALGAVGRHAGTAPDAVTTGLDADTEDVPAEDADAVSDDAPTCMRARPDGVEGPEGVPTLLLAGLDGAEGTPGVAPTCVLARPDGAEGTPGVAPTRVLARPDGAEGAPEGLPTLVLAGLDGAEGTPEDVPTCEAAGPEAEPPDGGRPLPADVADADGADKAEDDADGADEEASAGAGVRRRAAAAAVASAARCCSRASAAAFACAAAALMRLSRPTAPAAVTSSIRRTRISRGARLAVIPPGV